MKRSTRPMTVAFGVLPIAFALSCSKQLPPPGELVVAVSTDVSIPKDIDTIRMQVLSNGAFVYDNAFAVFPGEDGVKIPVTLGVVAGSDPTAKVVVRVMAISHNVALVLREATVQVPTDRTALLQLPLQWLSYHSAADPHPADPKASDPTLDDIVEATCKANETEVAGHCVSDAVDESKLPDFEPASVFGGGGADGGGTCFDTIACFPSAAAVALDMSDCTVPMPETTNASKINVAFVPASGAGICKPNAPGQCFVPVDNVKDADAPGDGWTMMKSGRIQLPLGFCDKVKSGLDATVTVSTACETKTSGVPTCGKWSTEGTGGGNSLGGGTVGSDEGGIIGASDGGTETEDSGVAFDAAANSCPSLSACCASLPSADQTACQSLTLENEEAVCAEELATLVESGFCGTGKGSVDASSDASVGVGGGVCEGRGPDESSPIGAFTGSGTIPGELDRPVSLATLVDGYASLQVVSDPSADGGSEYILDLTLTPYTQACGYYSNDVAVIGATPAVIEVTSESPFTTGDYTTNQVSAGSTALPPGTVAGPCSLGSGNGGNMTPSGNPTTALTIASIDANTVAGTFSFSSATGILTGNFSLPLCTAKDMALCCVLGASSKGDGGSLPGPDAGALPDAGTFPLLPDAGDLTDAPK